MREVWRNEPRNFTTWLASNIEFLNEKIDANLNVMQTEKQVGSFNVDIFCEDEHGNNVIIENQLEKTDHTHLGQILTYSVGTAAKTVIWISPEPRVEHIEVVEWLNEITPVDNSWYLFKLEVIKGNNDTVFPLFTKMVGPSEVVKNLGNEKKVEAERHHKRIEFWERLLVLLNQETPLYNNVNPSTDNYLNASTGIGGLSYQILVRQKNSSLILVIEKKSTELNKKIFDYFYSKKDDIENEFGAELMWRKMEDNKSSKIQFDINNCCLDKSTWENGMPVLVNEFIKWHVVLRKYLDKSAVQKIEEELF
ncbi:DUF4268 domain-containing protein [Metabacillus fastidiosus]|uniref:DUF4268 domain-containing protein n=1 Tax=Metabacillus fastidiosus TaxID=1458 RepID=UPI002E1C2DC6|nr:DUF4268 domain-containing protein [Metabacillus fastidiosus]